MAVLGAKNAGANKKYDCEFRFLLAVDPSFEDWRAMANSWYSSQIQSPNKFAALVAFFLGYLHAQSLDKNPVTLFGADAQLPDLCQTLGMGKDLGAREKQRHDTISDFLDWVLHTRLALPDSSGRKLVPAELRNPFPRIQNKNTKKGVEITFAYVLAIDQHLVHWQGLASEWLSMQKSAVASRLIALDKFLIHYIVGCNQPRNPVEWFKRSTPKPRFSEILLKIKTKGAVGSLAATDIKHNNHVRNFLGWVLAEKLALEDDHGNKVVPLELHNPVVKLSRAGIASPTETTKSSLSIRYIKDLRVILAEGPNFRDWKWVQQVIKSKGSFGDWFLVDPKLVNLADSDCVWRERGATKHERGTLKLPPRVTELWSPVRAVALYIKLELPLRTFQVRMLDSGEGDTWRYEHKPEGGSFVLNESALATGSALRPYQRGVFHRSANDSGAGLFINTNKTADANKPESAKGYVVPWAHETVLYWLEKLRCWQERYNPIQRPTAWGDLKMKHFGETPPHPEVLAARGTACFLFRDAAATGQDRHKPLAQGALDRMWFQLLACLEQRCAERGESLGDGSPIKFVQSGSLVVTHYPLHALRVSLISYLVLDLQLPLAVVSKLIAGHACIIMTLYYTKVGHAHMKEVLSQAERNTLAADEANHKRFLMDATLDQVSQRFASISVDAMRAAVGQKSAAGFVFEDKGICPVGGSMCDVGGAALTDQKNNSYFSPVPGYPRERNCVRCRFFLSGPAFLPGLQAHFNTASYEAYERAERHNDLLEKVTLLENQRAECEREGHLFTQHRELESLSQHYEAEAEAMGKLVNDMQATYHLIGRSLEILKNEQRQGVQLVAVGEMSDIRAGFVDTPSALHQIEVLCENAVIYPAIDARKPVLQRSQALDCMLEFNKMKPVFFHLSYEQQLAAGNAVMQLIQARTGSIKGALEYVEGLGRLRDLGIADETWNVIAEKVAGTPALQIIDSARKNRALPALQGGKNAP